MSSLKKIAQKACVVDYALEPKYKHYTHMNRQHVYNVVPNNY